MPTVHFPGGYNSEKKIQTPDSTPTASISGKRYNIIVILPTPSCSPRDTQTGESKLGGQHRVSQHAVLLELGVKDLT